MKFFTGPRSGSKLNSLEKLAISGLNGVYDGIYAVSQGTFPGKIVVYPHIVGLGLTPLPALKERLPDVYARLGEGEVWTVEAEEELLRSLL